MIRNLFLAAAILCPILVSAQTVPNEQMIRAYLTQKAFDAYELKNAVNIKMSKDEDEFRSQFKTEFLAFVNTYGNANGLEADFDSEDMTDSMIKSMYEEMFEFDDLTPAQIETNAAAANIDHDHFIKMVDHCKRFLYLKDDPNGTYHRSEWTVIVDKEKVTLTFYLDDKGVIIDFQEDWPDF